MRKIIHFFIFVSAAALIVLMPDQVAAEESPVKTKTDNKSVMLDIQEDGDYYKVFKDDQLVYEGTSSQFKDKLTNDIQKYKIGVFEKKQSKKSS
ncbi:hypothetical protein VSK91_03840 [Bacillus swezeyi]|uniref:hypothetical protein n=1 Tax=Bacillus swezeyi TaxID=1925020 RepID=UPI0039C68951